jgi:hypothetical protein
LVTTSLLEFMVEELGVAANSEAERAMKKILDFIIQYMGIELKK